jgi:hypothetical protein
MSDLPEVAADVPDAERATEFVKTHLSRLIAYQTHKESMAWAGLAVFGAAIGAGLASDVWPPAWISKVWTPWLGACVTIVAITALLLIVLVYLRFQLRRRRWASLRIAGCERVLAEWICKRPSRDDLEPHVPLGNDPSRLTLLCDLFWPRLSAVKALRYDEEPLYPRTLAIAWHEQTHTDAIYHEWLVAFATYALYVALIARTIFLGRS